jgi:hypothetical protein
MGGQEKNELDESVVNGYKAPLPGVLRSNISWVSFNDFIIFYDAFSWTNTKKTPML